MSSSGFSLASLDYDTIDMMVTSQWMLETVGVRIRACKSFLEKNEKEMTERQKTKLLTQLKAGCLMIKLI